MRKILCAMLMVAVVMAVVPGAQALEPIEVPESAQMEIGDNIDTSAADLNADADDNDDLLDEETRDLLIKGGIAAGVAVGTFFVGRYAYNRYQASSYYDEARSYAQRGEWDRAVEAFETALDYRSGHADARERLEEARREAVTMFINEGDELRAEERYEEALAKYQKALDYNPDSMRARSAVDEMAQELVEVHYRRGYQYETQNRWEEALAEYEKAYHYNVEYEDLDDRFHRAKARVHDEDLPVRALFFMINRTDISNIERPFLNYLQDHMMGIADPDFFMLSRAQIQEVMDEQAEALAYERDADQAAELGRIMGADEVVIGEITEVYSSLGRLHLDVELEIIDTETEETAEEIEYAHNFGWGVSEAEIPDRLREVATSLVEEKFE